MNQRFELRLHHQARATIGVLLAIPGLMAVGFISLNHIIGKTSQLVWFCAIMIGGGYSVYRLIRWWAVYKVEVIIQTSSFEVQCVSSEEFTRIPFAELSSYRYESFNDRMVLCLRLNNGRRKKLLANGLFGKVGDFDGMVKALESAVAAFGNQAGVLIKREKTFFEKPISTFLLVGAGGVICYAIVYSIQQGHPIRGNMISGLGILITYFGGWLAASKRRNEK